MSQPIDQTWLREAIRQNPCVLLPSGDVRTCPVRLSYPHLFKAHKSKKSDNPNAEPKFNTALLFPLGADITALQQAAGNVLTDKFSGFRDPQGQYHGVHTPFRDQREKAWDPVKQAAVKGWTAGAVFINVSSKFKPNVVDLRMNPIVDETKVYGGVWAIVTLNCYPFGLSPPQPKKGVNFGLQSVMIIADDEPLGDGLRGGNPQEDFGGVQIQQSTDVAGQFGMSGVPMGQGGFAPPAAAALPTYGMPPFSGVQGHTAPPTAPTLDDMLG